VSAEEIEARYRRRAIFLAYFLAPVVGYETAQLYEHWAVRNPFLSGQPLLRIPLGLASLALGGWLGYSALRLAGSAIIRIWAGSRRR
jgi:hypothetical protein